MPYIVILFEEDNSVEAVPVHWFKNGQCLWPNKPFDAKRLIESQAPSKNFEFKKYKARQLSGEICKFSI